MSAAAAGTGPAALFERSLWVGWLSAVLAVSLLAARNTLVPPPVGLGLGAAFGAALAVAYALPAAVVGLLLALLAGAARRPRLACRLQAGLALLVLLVACSANHRAWRLALVPSGVPLPFGLGLLAALACAVSGLLWVAWTAWSAARGEVRRAATRQLRWLGLVAAVCAGTALGPWGAPRTPGGGPVGEPRPPVPSGPKGAGASRPPLLVVGLDGADWRYAEPLIARGELPHLAALRARGAYGPLHTVEPTLSPIVWTTIATGQPPHRHGIDGFTSPRLAGVAGRLPDLHPLRRLGFGWVLRGLERGGWLRQVPVGSHERRAAAFWELAALAGPARPPLVLVGWWATWPAEPLRGFVVSDRAYGHFQTRGREAGAGHGLTYPPEIYRSLAALAQRYDEVPDEALRAFADLPAEELQAVRREGRGHPADPLRELPYFVSLFETTRRQALELMQRARRTWDARPDTLVLFRLVDQVCHTSLHYSDLVSEHLDAPAAERQRHAGAVSAAYRQVDRALGELVAACGPDCHVVVLSDHGFTLEDFPGGLRRYHHSRAPDGLLVASGPAFRAGPVEGLDVFHLLPLLAYLADLPLARDLRHGLPETLLDPTHLAARPPRWIASYGPRHGAPLAAAGSQAVDDELIERLRALGYVQ